MGPYELLEKDILQVCLLRFHQMNFISAMK